MKDAPGTYAHNAFDKPTVAVDFDGVLCIRNKPNRDLITNLSRMRAAGWQVVVYSARPAKWNIEIRDWLRAHRIGIGAGYLIEDVSCGAKPVADLYIDDHGLNAPFDACWEFAELKRAGKDYSRWTCEGGATSPMAVEMGDYWRNPNAQERGYDRFTVTVLVSGGIDSTCAWAMAVRAGLPVQPLFIDTTDSGLRAREWEAVCSLHDSIGGAHPVHIHKPIEYTKWEYIDRGRNAVLTMLAAERMTECKQWGEIWFSNVAQFSETPVRGGDKSHRFLASMQQLLTLAGHDVRLVTPVGAMDKYDCVSWLLLNSHVETVKRTFSCYEAGRSHCGRCVACFRRWVALTAAGVEGAWEGTGRFDFTEATESYLLRRASKSELVEWSDSRCARSDRIIRRAQWEQGVR